jgi:molecular chaperone DnaK
MLRCGDGRQDAESHRKCGKARAFLGVLGGAAAAWPLAARAQQGEPLLVRRARIVVSLFDLGKDDTGKPIDLEVPLTRSQLESLMGPLLEEMFCPRSGGYVGRPSSWQRIGSYSPGGRPHAQTPILRAMLSSRFGAPVDFSIDPMTVVGRGAAIYASALERTKSHATPQTTRPTEGDRATLKLAYEPVSAELQCTVAGRVTASGGKERKIPRDACSDPKCWGIGSCD